MTPFHPDFLGEAARRIGLKTYPSTRQFVVQHLYPDTLRLLRILHAHVPIECVISIGYSGDEEVIQALRDEGIPVHTPPYSDLAATVQAELGKALARCKKDNLHLMIHEVGGYAIKALHEAYPEDIHLVKGAVEVTKQGVWVAESLPVLRVPQVNCAQTRLKEIEGKTVGEAVVAALDSILRQLGYAMVGRKALVTGYGWVGAGTAKSLKDRGMQVSVMDTDVLKCVEAAVDGYTLARSPKDIDSPAILIGASGSRSITPEVIDHLPHRCFIVSGASKDHEVDLAYLASITQSTQAIHPHVDAHHLKDGRTLFLVNKGYPVNFTGSSVPDEIVEFLFAELIMLVPELLDQDLAPGIYPLRPELERIAAEIWLELR